MKKAVIFLNGNPYIGAVEKNHGDIFICADGAYNWVRGRFSVDVILGDMDSVDARNIEDNGIEKILFPAEKDYTDGHLAVEFAVKRGYKRIEIYGAGGGRLDHQVANLYLLKLCKDLGADGIIVGGGERVYFANGDFKLNVNKNSIVSVVPFSDAAHITNTSGLKYPIENKIINKHLIGISNIAVDNEIHIGLTEGEILVFVCDS